MDERYLQEYERVTQGFHPPQFKYTTPEEQGAAIKKCSILEEADIEYSNRTILYGQAQSACQ